eukprot:scaffold26027_cov70-Attheya_sp.AAC.3
MYVECGKLTGTCLLPPSPRHDPTCTSYETAVFAANVPQYTVLINTVRVGPSKTSLRAHRAANAQTQEE